MASRDDHLVYHLERDWERAELDEQDTAMLRFACKLNFHPGRVAGEDMEALRAVGFDDRGILDIILITALFNFMNRLVDGVGIRAQEPFRRNKERGDARVEAELSGRGGANPVAESAD